MLCALGQGDFCCSTSSDHREKLAHRHIASLVPSSHYASTIRPNYMHLDWTHLESNNGQRTRETAPPTTAQEKNICPQEYRRITPLTIILPNLHSACTHVNNTSAPLCVCERSCRISFGHGERPPTCRYHGNGGSRKCSAVQL